jgi:hypothetical protein
MRDLYRPAIYKFSMSSDQSEPPGAEPRVRQKRYSICDQNISNDHVILVYIKLYYAIHNRYIHFRFRGDTLVPCSDDNEPKVNNVTGALGFTYTVTS